MRDKIIVISGPSGSGKTTVARALLSDIDRLEFSISSTTRNKRINETDGIDYYFIQQEEFVKMIKNDEFIEYQEVYENIYYGTTKKEINRIFAKNKIPLLDIDVMGALKIKELYKEKALLVFIHPGNAENLRKRLSQRKTDSPEMINKRLERAQFEISQSVKFDAIIMNDQSLEQTISQAKVSVIRFLEQ